MAELVAEASSDSTRRTNRALARSLPEPTSLPTPDELWGPGAAAHYARASFAVAAAQERWGRDAVMRWFVDWSAPGRPSDEDLTRTYLDAYKALA